LRDNQESFRRWQLVPRVLVDVDVVDLSTTVLGIDVAGPVLGAPVALA
jgi:isopentenyl diphosphate isomerase/L-lactate dehydrogenase-like FMN-dependent dehydrogenase